MVVFYTFVFILVYKFQLIALETDGNVGMILYYATRAPVKYWSLPPLGRFKMNRVSSYKL